MKSIEIYLKKLLHDPYYVHHMKSKERVKFFFNKYCLKTFKYMCIADSQAIAVILL